MLCSPAWKPIWLCSALAWCLRNIKCSRTLSKPMPDTAPQGSTPANLPPLPGAAGNKPNPPPLVGTNISPELRAQLETVWVNLAAAKQALDAILAIFQAHPELISIMKTSGQGKLP